MPVALGFVHQTYKQSSLLDYMGSKMRQMLLTNDLGWSYELLAFPSLSSIVVASSIAYSKLSGPLSVSFMLECLGATRITRGTAC